MGETFMEWLERVKKNIFPLSLEQTNIRKAIDEWIYEGNMLDLEIAEESCEICDQPNIRYQFEIINKNNDNTLLVGSECITKFEIPVLDSSGVKLSSNDAKKKVNRDRNKLVTEAKEKHVINSLIKLKAIDETFNIDSLLEYYKERKAFTTKQLSMLIWRLDDAKIDYNKANFKVTIKRGREKDQLMNLEDWRLRKLWQCLSSSQKKLVEDKISGSFKVNGEL